MRTPSLTWLWTGHCSLSFATTRSQWTARAELWLSAWPLPARGSWGQLMTVRCSSLQFPDHPGPRSLCSPHPVWPPPVEDPGSVRALPQAAPWTLALP